MTTSIDRIATDAIELRLDGRPRRTPAGITLADLVGQLGHTPSDVATSVNGSFVARAERANRILVDGDAVMLFQPIAGG